MVVAQQSPEGALTFGKNYAILNLDWMAVLIDAVKNTTEGQSFISNCSRWNDAVHEKDPRPLTIFTSLSFHHGQPELAKGAPFTKLLQGFGSLTTGSPGVQIASNFTVDEKDIVLQKTRFYAGAGNALEQILKAQNIDTVILSGLSISGVILSTIYRLYDLDYNIYVISDNVLQSPMTPELSKFTLEALLPIMKLKTISIEEALQALKRS
ncbi:Isochorismatase hydrolase [Xylona heveae TC161]|uniref:Isochorismatase hydrolase n=1 Tax=Xylona heveae (strain CBS 132557 / TC161) TaxID=1328760 RepID=A0A165G3G9_XYLHT|nr:Isochorismatase hydrolase [Xylona heveae TC161]KZF21695.1 Isochorismatase hydrolase [Xylona heveae TC161]